MCKMLRVKTIGLLILIAAAQLINADYYSANAGLEDLLETEEFFIKNLESFIEAEKQRNLNLRNYIASVEHEIFKMKNDSVAYFGNPLNAWKTIKRMTLEWRDFYFADLNNKNIEEYEKGITAHVTETEIRQPVLDDLLGAAKGIARLQRTYNLESSHLANGTILGHKVSLEMTAADCYDLGMSLLSAKDYKNSATWLLEARARLARERQTAIQRGFHNFPYVADDTVLDSLVLAVMQNGNAKLALWLIREQLAVNPENPKALENFRVVEEQLKNERLTMERGEPKEAVKKPLTTTEMYEKTCSGELKQTPSEQRELRCRYVHNNVPFCFIAPFKMEELSLEPLVAFYHEVIYEDEIDDILEAAEDDIERSTVGSGTVGAVSDIRTSKNTWLWYEQHEFLAPIAQRLADITGLSLISAEALQVANYGIGGHYGPHYDFSEKKDYDYRGKGNRILTALFYINDVEFGGATAFPYLRLSVPPIRRSLVIWHNLHRSLELDYRTKHAGCPVVKGSKWICNEWFHTIGQEFLRPCGLEPDGYMSEQYKKFGGVA